MSSRDDELRQAVDRYQRVIRSTGEAAAAGDIGPMAYTSSRADAHTGLIRKVRELAGDCVQCGSPLDDHEDGCGACDA
jgi:hypothetical protein